VLGRFAPGARRASGPVPVIADVSQKKMIFFLQRLFARLVIICAVSLSACQIHGENEHSWRKKDFLNRCFVRPIDNGTEQLCFYAEGHDVAVTVDRKIGKMYYSFAPLFKWRMKNGFIEVYDDRDRIYTTLMLLSRRENSFIVKNHDGDTVTYTYK